MLNLGPHCQRSTPNGLMWARSAPIVKAIDNVAVLEAAPDSAIRIWRHFDAFESSTAPDATVFNLLASLNGYNHPRLYLQVWTGAHPSRADLTRAVALCHAAGYKCGGSSWYTGDYTQADWDDATAAGVDCYLPQCYWGNQGFTLDHALRYRRYQKSGQLVLVAECGRDAVEGGLGGWHWDGLSAKQAAVELAAYALELEKDGAYGTAFDLGWYEPWESFDLETVVPELLPMLEADVPKPIVSSTSCTLFCDISNRQGAVDTPLLARCVPVAIFKASEGTDFRDGYFGPNWYAAGVNEMARGAYHFGRPFSNSGHDEAMFFLDQLTRNGINSGDVLALDLEEDPNGDATNRADLRAYALDFLTTIYGALGFRPLLYSRVEYMERHNLIGSSDLAQYGLWLADYQTSAFPTAPSPWPVVAAWQYGQGPLPGVSGAVDLDIFNGSVDQFRMYGKP